MLHWFGLHAWSVVADRATGFTCEPGALSQEALTDSGRGPQMAQNDAVIAVFADRHAAEAAVKQLVNADFDMRTISVVGKGYHTEEKVVGFYNAGDRIRFWGKRGAFWGGLWGLFFGGVFMTIPIIGHVIVLGYLTAMVISAIEGAVVVGGLSALGAALYSTGIPKDSVIDYESAVKADGFLVMAHGPSEEMARAKAVLDTSNPTRLDLHEGVQTPVRADHAVHAAT
jgi:hypothetical protein